MKLLQTILLVVAGGLGIASCAKDATRGEEPEVDQFKAGVALTYAEKEEGNPESAVRLYVNAEFIRIDEQSAPNDFILFDRKKRTIYNVITSEKSVSVISPKPVTVAAPIPIKFTEEKLESAAVTRGAEHKKGFYSSFLQTGRRVTTW